MKNKDVKDELRNVWMVEDQTGGIKYSCQFQIGDALQTFTETFQSMRETPDEVEMMFRRNAMDEFEKRGGYGDVKPVVTFAYQYLINEDQTVASATWERGVTQSFTLTYPGALDLHKVDSLFKPAFFMAFPAALDWRIS